LARIEDRSLSSNESGTALDVEQPAVPSTSRTVCVRADDGKLRWFWSITVYVPPRLNVRSHDKVTLAEAKRCFAKAWNAAKAHAR
jgi:hypothetical protein